MTLLCPPPTRPARWTVGSMMAALCGLLLVASGCDEAGTDDGTAGTEDVGPVACIGLSLEQAAWSTDPYPVVTPIDADATGDTTEAPAVPDTEPDPDPCVASPGTCIGAPAPDFALTDFQPQSCGNGATYGLDAFSGHVTVAALLAGW